MTEQAIEVERGDVKLRHEHGSGIYLLESMTQAGEDWIVENLDIESWQRQGNAVVIDGRYAADITNALSQAGLNVVPDRSQREGKDDEPGWSKEVRRRRAERESSASPEARQFMANNTLRKFIDALTYGDKMLVEELSMKLSLHNHNRTNKEDSNGG